MATAEFAWKRPLEAARPILKNGFGAFRHRYAGSGVGVFWNVIHPLIQVILFSGVAWIIRGSSGGALGGLALCCALLPWLSFTESVTQSSQAMARNAGFLRSMNVSSSVFVAESAFASLLGMFVTLGLLILAVFTVQGALRLEIVLAVPAVTLFHTFAFGLALALSPLQAILPDVSEALRSGLYLWMWTMPIVYPAARVPSEWSAALEWNPSWIYVRSIRDLLVGGATVTPLTWLAMAGLAALALVAGRAALHRLEPSARDVL